MTTSCWPRPFTIALILSAAIFTIRCGGSNTPTSPTTTTGPAVSTVTVAASTLGVGGTVQGTVTLSANVSSASTITLVSSNSSVAAVPASVAIQSGSSTASFIVTGVAAGTASITASLNGSSSQSSTITVARVTLSSLTLSATTVVGGTSLTGTAGLSAPAPTGGAVVTLSGGDPLTVPASVTVPASATSATFTVFTRLVGGTIPGTVTAAYGGSSASASVSVTKPTIATASFGVTGPTETDTCTITNGGNTLNCTFNGSTSTAPGTIVAYDWSFRVSSASAQTPAVTQTTTGAVLAQPAVSCSWLPAAPLPAGANLWLPLTVALIVHDDQGNVSAQAVNSSARVFPQGVCGY